MTTIYLSTNLHELSDRIRLDIVLSEFVYFVCCIISIMRN